MKLEKMPVGLLIAAHEARKHAGKRLADCQPLAETIFSKLAIKSEKAERNGDLASAIHYAKRAEDYGIWAGQGEKDKNLERLGHLHGKRAGMCMKRGHDFAGKEKVPIIAVRLYLDAAWDYADAANCFENCLDGGPKAIGSYRKSIEALYSAYSQLVCEMGLAGDGKFLMGDNPLSLRLSTPNHILSLVKEAEGAIENLAPSKRKKS